MRRSSSRHALRRWILARLAPLILIVPLALVLFFNAHPDRASALRTSIADRVAPVIELVGQPFHFAKMGLHNVHEYFNLRRDNTALQDQVRLLHYYQGQVMWLKSENAHLKKITNYKQPGAAHSWSGRVIALSSNSFSQSVLIALGSKDGIERGMVAMVDQLLVGRVVEVGDHVARILLLTDPSSKIPVMIDGSPERALLVGDNDDEPYLEYLPPHPQLYPTQKIFTSGHDGIFPPGLLIGEIDHMNNEEISAKLYLDFDKLDYITIYDFGLKGSLTIEQCE